VLTERVLAETRAVACEFPTHRTDDDSIAAIDAIVIQVGTSGAPCDTRGQSAIAASANSHVLRLTLRMQRDAQRWRKTSLVTFRRSAYAGRSSKRSAPYRRQPTPSSHVFARSVGGGRATSSCFHEAPRIGSAQPSNHGALEYDQFR
jgi:hypothetical protein